MMSSIPDVTAFNREIPKTKIGILELKEKS